MDNSVSNNYEKMYEKTLTQTYHFKGKIINLRVDDVELSDGTVTIREIIEHPAVKRELAEEVGAHGTNWRSMGNLYPSPGYCGEIIRLFACDIDESGESHPDDGEFLEVEYIPLEKAVEMVLAGELSDAKTQTLVLKLFAERSKA